MLDDDDVVIINNKRYLKPERVVHHIDFNRKNNSPDNLFIFKNVSIHTSYHNFCKDYKYSLEEFFNYYNSSIFRNPDLLYDMYVNKKYNINKIAKQTHVKWDTVKRLIDKNINIKGA